MRVISAFLLLLAQQVVEAANSTGPVSGAKVVSLSGGQYTSLQSAIDSIDKQFTGTTNIFIQPGTYLGQTWITSGYNGKIVIQGFTANSLDYRAVQVTLSNDGTSANPGGNVATGTLVIDSPNVALYNVRVENTNTAGPNHALSADVDRLGFYGCVFTGWQDSVFVGGPGVVFKNSYIEGAVDFIYGTNANIWIENSDIVMARDRGGYITASGRSSADDNWYVFNKSRVFAKAGVTVRKGSVLLGRAWRAYSRVLFQNTELSEMIDPVGWGSWYNGNNTENIYYAEYNNSGPGSDTSLRVDWSYQLTSAVSIDDIMPNWRNWVDTKYWAL